MKNFNSFKLYESSINIPKNENYWIKKGKSGKNVALYFHDDLDGIYSAILMKNYLEKNGFKIVKYGVINYQEGYSAFNLDKSLINVVVDFGDTHEDVDIYIDHHGIFNVEDENVKKRPFVKESADSAYEVVAKQLGVPVDKLVLDVIKMIDSAKYDEYDIDLKIIFDFDIKKFKNKLEFAAAFNQLLKRSDYKTFIEVVANCKDMTPSIYNIYRLFKILFPANNLDKIKLKKLAKDAGFVSDDNKILVDEFIKKVKEMEPSLLLNFEKDFVSDAISRLEKMYKRTSGVSLKKSKNIESEESNDNDKKDIILSQDEIISKFSEIINGEEKIVRLNGMQIFGNLLFVPSGTYANPIRARAVYQNEIENGDSIKKIKYIIDHKSKLYETLYDKYQDEPIELIGDIKKDGNNFIINPIEILSNNDKYIGIKGYIKYDEDIDDIVFYGNYPILWLFLQYGNTLQVASLYNINKYYEKYLPEAYGEKVKNLGDYMKKTLCYFIRNFGYNVNVTSTKKTVAGGHGGIGTISNILGRVENPNTLLKVVDCDGKSMYEITDEARRNMEKYYNKKFLDLIKNKIISDLSGIKFKDLGMMWGEEREIEYEPKEKDYRTMTPQQIRDAQKVRQEYLKYKNKNK